MSSAGKVPRSSERRSPCWRNFRYSTWSICPFPSAHPRRERERTKSYRGKGDVSPVAPGVFREGRADRRDVLHALALPDTIREVRPMVEELERLKQVQCRRVQFVLIHDSMRRMVQQARVLPVPIEPYNLHDVVVVVVVVVFDSPCAGNEKCAQLRWCEHEETRLVAIRWGTYIRFFLGAILRLIW